MHVFGVPQLGYSAVEIAPPIDPDAVRSRTAGVGHGECKSGWDAGSVDV
ncbi:hypothetical protein K3495_g7129 [Podosphaera aphanis]|nr:hypothetical protein K3495_g7129 [Podosphaera aphanis]